MIIKKNSVRIYGVDVSYTVSGSIKNPNLLLLHGSGTFYKKSLKNSIYFIKELSKYFRVYAPQHPGFYSSSVPSHYTMEDYFYYVDKFVKEMSVNFEVVVGQSFGTRLAIDYVYKNPKKIKLLVLGNPAIYLDKTFRMKLFSNMLFFVVSYMPKFISDFMVRCVLAPKYIEKHRRKDYYNILELFVESPGRKFKNKIRCINTKTIIFFGNPDFLIPRRFGKSINKMILGSKLYEIEKSHPGMYRLAKKTVKIIKQNYDLSN